MVKKNQTEVVEAKKVTPIDNLRTMLANPSVIQQMKDALPKHITPARMIRVALTAVQKTPKLMECSSQSILGCIIEASEVGLEPSSVLGHAHLVPFKNKNTGRQEAQFIMGYKGMMDLARRSGKVSVITAEVVHLKDKFKVTKGLHPDLVHIPWDEDDDRGPIIAAYATAKLKDSGESQFISLSVAEIESYRSRSAAAKSKYSPWTTDYPAMCKKTAIRRLFVFLPCSVEAQEAVSRDELRDLNIMQGDDFIEAEANAQPSSLKALEANLDAKSAPEDPPDDEPEPSEDEYNDAMDKAEAAAERGERSEQGAQEDLPVEP